MSQALISESLLTGIANAIRAKNGSEDTYTPAQMATAIGNIPTGITPTGTKEITQNGTHDVTQYASANVNVPSVQPVLQSKTVTENGTVTPDAGYDGLSSVVVNVSGGTTVLCEIDFTKANFVYNGITINSDGANFGNSTNSNILLPFSRNGMTIEVEVGNMNPPSNSEGRFICATESRGFFFRNTGVWTFRGSSYENTGITDASYFANSTVKVHVDSSGLWHVYKDDTLVCESTIAINMGSYYSSYRAFSIGSTAASIQNTTIKRVRIY